MTVQKVQNQLAARSSLVQGSLKNAIPVLIEGIETVLLYLDKGDNNKAQSIFSEAILLMEKISRSTELLMQLDLNYNEKMSSAFEQLTAVLQEISTAMENEDLVLLNDLLRYELLPALNTWQDLVKT